MLIYQYLFFSFWLTSLYIRGSRFIYLTTTDSDLFLFMTEYIPLYHNFFIRSFVDGHLGSFHVLAIVNSAVMNIGVHVSFWIVAFSGCGVCPVVGLLGHMLALFLVSKGTSILSPLRLYESTLPPRVQEDSPFSTLSPAFIACRLLMIAILTNVRG